MTLFGRQRTIRINGDQFRASPFGLLAATPQMQVRGDRVGAPQNDQFAVRKRFHVGAQTRTERHRQARRTCAGADRAIQLGCTERVKKAAIHRCVLQHAHVAGVAVRQDRLGAMCADDRREFGGNSRQGFRPGNRYEPAFTLGANALERRFDARRVIGAQRIFSDLSTEHARGHAMRGRALHFNQFAVGDVIFQRARVRAIVGACAFDDRNSCVHGFGKYLTPDRPSK